MAVGGASLKLKRLRLRQRFGINAPKLARARPLFRILLVKLANSAGQATKEFRGALELLTVRQEGKNVIIKRLSKAAQGSANYHLEIKHHQRFEELFSVPLSATLKDVEAHVLQDDKLRTPQALALQEGAFMFGQRKRSTQQNGIDSLIGAGTRLDDDQTFSGGLRLEGSIEVSRAVINGAFVGPIVASDSLELLPNARVTGDVEYRQIEIQLGAVVEGRLVHQADTKTQELKLASSS
jgi:cytoskeletal protein CcmA (bactofilin family)